MGFRSRIPGIQPDGWSGLGIAMRPIRTTLDQALITHFVSHGTEVTAREPGIPRWDSVYRTRWTAEELHATHGAETIRAVARASRPHRQVRWDLSSVEYYPVSSQNLDPTGWQLVRSAGPQQLPI
jgi:hypothetical protein